MRKIAILLFLIVCATAASAQATANTLIVESKGGEKFYLKVDGFRRNKVAKNRVEVKGLYATKTRITVIFEDTLNAAVRNYEVVLVTEKGKKEVRPMNNFVARYQIVAGKKKSKVKRLSIRQVNSVPVYKPMPVSDNKR
ncbi:MAG: hypothetical protein KBT41_02300 [bacterium]|nr:hypothetical protein [Candidatus Colousia faecequi]